MNLTEEERGDAGVLRYLRNMEIAKLILEYLKVLIWPTLVLIFLFVFRKQLHDLVERLKKADLPGGVSLDFGKEAEEAKQLSKKVEALPPPKEAEGISSIPLNEVNKRLIALGLRPSTSGLDMSYYREIANRDPNLALAGLRIEFEIAFKNLAKGFKIDFDNKTSGSQLLRTLRDQGALTNEQFDLALKIWELSNRAVHGVDVTKYDAMNVLDAAEVLIEQFVSWLSWGFGNNQELEDNVKASEKVISRR